MDVEMVFRDIDANGIVLHLFRASACHSGLSPGYPFGPKEKTRADPTVARPLERSAGSRSDPRHCREGCHPSGYLTYIITTRRMTSGELLKYRNGLLMRRSYAARGGPKNWSGSAFAWALIFAEL